MIVRSIRTLRSAVPGGKGDFIVKVDGREIWNKRKMGDQFPAEQQIIARLPSP